MKVERKVIERRGGRGYEMDGSRTLLEENFWYFFGSFFGFLEEEDNL